MHLLFSNYLKTSVSICVQGLLLGRKSERRAEEQACEYYCTPEHHLEDEAAVCGEQLQGVLLVP
jgi:hypothetical protein